MKPTFHHSTAPVLALHRARLSHAPACISTFVLAVLLSVLAGCSTSRDVADVGGEKGRPHETLNAAAWVQLSAEYAAVAEQTYQNASDRLAEALADSSWSALFDVSGPGSRPTAIIVDVDETVLDNSPFQARLIRDDTSYTSEAWNRWVLEARARPMPGAVAFLRSARDGGVTVFYVTNRRSSLEAATRQNLVSTGFPVESGVDVVLMRGERPSWTGDKSSRRAFIGEQYRVLFLFGDDLNDFVRTEGVSTRERREIVERMAEMWGRRWYILPNPVYGSWERTLIRETGARSRWEGIRAKSAALHVD